MISNLLTCLLLAVSASPVDQILEKTWIQQGIEPVPVCTDEEFLRRITLDLVGRIPTLDELHAFQAQPDRSAKIDTLLASGEFARSWSEVWTGTLVGYSDAFGADREVLRTWLEASFRDDLPYDELVRQLITAREPSALSGPSNFLVRHREEPVMKITQLFLGVRLDCARCHDHPFDRWTQDDFESMRRFFAATRQQQVTENNFQLVNLVPGDNLARPRFLTGAIPRTTQWRDEFALFTIRSKPFARTFANRFWYHFLGRGIVNPPDDANAENPPAVSELLEHLAEQARGDGFSVHGMIRRICNSRAYQLSSESDQADAEREAVFACRVLKPMTPEQMFDSLQVALKFQATPVQRRAFIRVVATDALDADFSNTWDYRETAQALLTRLASQTPAPEANLDELFLRTLTRLPTERERDLCKSRTREEIAFALINGNEFYFNH